jgi:outer membrane protein assembly factor BamB
VLWTVPLGKGFGGPAVKDGQVYILDRDGSKGDILRCFELATGKELWRYAYDAPGAPSPSGSRSTPAVDERFVYSVGPFGHFTCVDRATHQPVWRKHFGTDFGATQPRWGIAQNPLLCGDLVIVAPQGQKAGVAAFEKATGRVVWSSPYLPGMASSAAWQGSYSSPILARIGGVDHVVVLAAKVATKEGKLVSRGQVAGISARDGSALWSYTGWQSEIPIPYAAVAGVGRLFVTGAACSSRAPTAAALPCSR